MTLSLGSGQGPETLSSFGSPGGSGGGLRCFLMPAAVSGPCLSLWALQGQLSGSQLTNGSAPALNTDASVQLEEQLVVLRQPSILISLRPGFSLAAGPVLTYLPKTQYGSQCTPPLLWLNHEVNSVTFLTPARACSVLVSRLFGTLILLVLKVGNTCT